MDYTALKIMFCVFMFQIGNRRKVVKNPPRADKAVRRFAASHSLPFDTSAPGQQKRAQVSFHFNKHPFILLCLCQRWRRRKKKLHAQSHRAD